MHLKALETYEVIFKIVGTRWLAKDLFLYRYDGFPRAPLIIQGTRAPVLENREGQAGGIRRAGLTQGGGLLHTLPEARRGVACMSLGGLSGQAGVNISSLFMFYLLLLFLSSPEDIFSLLLERGEGREGERNIS